MNDTNEVNKEKQMLLEWLISFGRNEVTIYEIVGSGVYNINMWWFVNRGLLSENTTTDIYRFALTDKGMEFINEQRS